ncbi:hypothetical protein PLICRDRAFT_54066 [Plicaturopsis crispa FD-325 SS-3]|nr:hypothetical protein PLICRDRAFT_54066 [Plicaturopsis crispa FD-325 SS-3]
MSLGTDLFGLIAGALGLLALFHSIVISQLPKTKIKDLDAILRDTADQFYHDKADGLLANKHFVSQVEEQLLAYHLTYNRLRTRALGAKSFFAEFLELLKGLSISISTLYREISYLQADIITTSQEARMEMARTGRLQNLQNRFARRSDLTRPASEHDQVPLFNAGHMHRSSSPGALSTEVRLWKKKADPYRGRKRTLSCPPEDVESNINIIFDSSILLAPRKSDCSQSAPEASQLHPVPPVSRDARPSQYRAPKFVPRVLFGPPSRPDGTILLSSFAESNALERGELR